jgi:hypothetical protein
MSALDLIGILLATILTSAWVSAWLNWCFHGEVRHALVAAFPAKWRGDVSREEIMGMSADDLLVHLCGVSKAPEFLNRLLCCPSCLSAYISATGALFAAIGFGLPLLSVPLVWAAAAYCGLQVFRKL